MKNKIGILTFHYSFNEGALLQCFGLVEYLKNLLPNYDIEVLDFRYRQKEACLVKRTENNRRKALQQFQTLFPVSPCFYDEAAAVAYVNSNYDKIIVGSDAVWACEKYPKATAMQPLIPTFYFLPTTITIPKYAYACSIASSKYGKLPKKLQTQLSSRFDDFVVIGTRDINTQTFVNNLTHTLTIRTPDPTFLCDFSQYVDNQKLKTKLIQHGVDFNKQVILCSDIKKATRKFLPQITTNTRQIISTHPSNTGLSLASLQLSPFEWYALFGLVDFVITHRMHPTIMCLLHNTPFMTFDTRPKTKDLLGYFNLLDKVYPDANRIPQLINNWSQFNILSTCQQIKQLGTQFCNDYISSSS